MVSLHLRILATSILRPTSGGCVENTDMKLIFKILIVVFLLVVLLEVLTRDPYTVYDCRDTDQYQNYPKYIIKKCLEYKPRLST